MRVLADTVGINHNVIWRLETGQSDPSLSLAARLARILDLSLDGLIRLGDEPASSAAA